MITDHCLPAVAGHEVFLVRDDLWAGYCSLETVVGFFVHSITDDGKLPFVMPLLNMELGDGDWMVTPSFGWYFSDGRGAPMTFDAFVKTAKLNDVSIDLVERYMTRRFGENGIRGNVIEDAKAANAVSGFNGHEVDAA